MLIQLIRMFIAEGIIHRELKNGSSSLGFTHNLPPPPLSKGSWSTEGDHAAKNQLPDNNNI